MGDQNTDANNSGEENPEAQFEAKVNEVVDGMKQDDKGNWQLPEGDHDPSVLVAAKAVKRQRDTQAAYTKSRQELKHLQTTNEKMKEELMSSASLHITKEQQEELDELKMRDPEAWREKLNEHEQAAKQSLQEKLDNIEKDGKEMSELEVRKAQMEAFTDSTGIELNDDIIENELPARMSKDLKNGKITFDEFLTKAQKFLTSEKTIKGAEEDDEKLKNKNKNLSDLSGGPEPSSTAQNKDAIQSYENEVY